MPSVVTMTFHGATRGDVAMNEAEGSALRGARVMRGVQAGQRVLHHRQRGRAARTVAGRSLTSSPG